MSTTNDDVAIYFAMLKAGHKPKPKASPVEYARRSRSRNCRCNGAIATLSPPGETAGGRNAAETKVAAATPSCLKGGLPRVPRDIQRRTREAIVAAMPRNIGTPEREARLCMPAIFMNKTPPGRPLLARLPAPDKSLRLRRAVVFIAHEKHGGNAQ